MRLRPAILLCVFICCGVAPGFAAEAERPHLRELRIALQKKHGELVKVPLNTKLAEVKFTRVDLTKTKTEIMGNDYYAFSFRTPRRLGELVWGFVAEKGIGEFYIVPGKGVMTGFDMYNHLPLPRDIDGIGKKGDKVVLQDLAAENLKPDSDYIIWFRYAGEANLSVTLSLNLFPRVSGLPLGRVFPMLKKKKKKR